jgi:hypothetical protein
MAYVLATTDRETGLVWYLQRGRPPAASVTHAEEFAEFASAGRLGWLRVPGLPENVPLILGLAAARRRGLVIRLQACAGRAASPGGELHPSAVLYTASNYENAPSKGGWHDLSSRELSSYRIAEAVTAGADAYSRLVEHPAWPVLSLFGLDADAVARVIADILDPRYFIDQEDPDSQAPLDTFLGLDMKMFRRLHENHKMTSPRARRCLALWSAWSLPTGGLRFADAVPHGDGSRDPLEAALVVSRKFVSLLRHVWLDGLYPNRGADRLFCPEMLLLPETAAICRRRFHSGAC